MAGYGGETGTGGVAGGGGGAPSLDIRRMRSNQNQPFSQQINNGSISSGGKQLLNLTQRVDSSDISLFSADEDKGKSVLPAARNLRFNNQGDSALGVSLKLNHWSSGTAEDSEPNKYIHFIVGKGESLNMPITRMIASDNSAIDAGTAVANVAPADRNSGNLYIDSGTTLAENVEDSDTEFNVANGAYFRSGDLIQLGINTTTATRIEIMKVVTVTDTDGDGLYTAANLIVSRALYGTSAADKDNQTDGTNGAVSGAKIYFPIFNTYHDYDGLSTARTDNDGKYACTNLLMYGRGIDVPTSGILPGSVAIKCYNPGYQELGMSGITPGTNSGLEAGGSFWLKIAIDGSTAESINFTVDANNTNFGGRNGVLGKIQQVLNEKYYNTSANIFEKKATVGIVNGDIRFTSGSYLSTSAIALTAGADGASASYNIFGHATNPTGRIPGLNNIPSAVAAILPDDTITDNTTGETMSNTAGFMYDDGRGRLVGNGSGTINYDTGAINFVSKPNASFVVSLVHTSALSGKVTETTKNTIEEIKVRSMNAKVTGKINLVVEG